MRTPVLRAGLAIAQLGTAPLVAQSPDGIIYFHFLSTSAIFTLPASWGMMGYAQRYNIEGKKEFYRQLINRLPFSFVFLIFSSVFEFYTTTSCQPVILSIFMPAYCATSAMFNVASSACNVSGLGNRALVFHLSKSSTVLLCIAIGMSHDQNWPAIIALDAIITLFLSLRLLSALPNVSSSTTTQTNSTKDGWWRTIETFMAALVWNAPTVAASAVLPHADATAISAALKCASFRSVARDICSICYLPDLSASVRAGNIYSSPAYRRWAVSEFALNLLMSICVIGASFAFPNLIPGLLEQIWWPLLIVSSVVISSAIGPSGQVLSLLGEAKVLAVTTAVGICLPMIIALISTFAAISESPHIVVWLTLMVTAISLIAVKLLQVYYINRPNRALL